VFLAKLICFTLGLAQFFLRMTQLFQKGSSWVLVYEVGAEVVFELLEDLREICFEMFGGSSNNPVSV